MPASSVPWAKGRKCEVCGFPVRVSKREGLFLLTLDAKGELAEVRVWHMDCRHRTYEDAVREQHERNAG